MAKGFNNGEHITEKMKLNFLANILHKNFIYEGKEIICELEMNELLREYTKEVTANEMPNPRFDKKKEERLEFSKKALRGLVTDGYFTINKGLCSPTDKFWNQDEFKEFYNAFKSIS